jgi:hypothetical protein
MNTQETFDEIMKFFFTMQILNKMYHLTTTSFARHKASDAFDDDIQKHIDKFAEVYIGRYNVKINITKLNLNPEFISEIGIERLFKDSRDYLENLDRLVNNTELLNIRDEMLANINKTLYLFRLQ